MQRQFSFSDHWSCSMCGKTGDNPDLKPIRIYDIDSKVINVICNECDILPEEGI